MRNLTQRTIALTALAAAVALVPACGDSPDTGNQSAPDVLDSNLMLNAPGKDASAMESVLNANEPAPAAEDWNQSTDSGGNSVDSNQSGR
jgi:hypothetical protein